MSALAEWHLDTAGRDACMGRAMSALGIWTAWIWRAVSALVAREGEIRRAPGARLGRMAGATIWSAREPGRVQEIRA